MSFFQANSRYTSRMYVSLLALIIPFAIALSGALAGADTTIIGGEIVDKAAFPDVILISTGAAFCSATLVGPRAIITASHCGQTGSKVKFSIAGQKYEADLTRSPLYDPNDLLHDHDIAMGLITTDVTGVAPATIGTTSTLGQDLTIFGYGCTGINSNNRADGNLRKGETSLAKYYGYSMILERTTGGSCICFGDSGGPAFDESTDRRLLIGIHSRGDIYDTSSDIRLDIPESQSFISIWAKTHKADVCGVTAACR